MQRTLIALALISILAGGFTPSPVLAQRGGSTVCPATIRDGAQISSRSGVTSACCTRAGGTVATQNGQQVCDMPEGATIMEPRTTNTTNNSNNANTSSQSGANTPTTQPAPQTETTQSQSTNGPGAGASTGGQAQNTSGNTFVPLTTIPGVGDVTGAADLPAFLNSLYMISVGAAAVLAVLQIIRSGITYMLNDSGVTEKRDAKKHIMMSVLGLVLVLSPALVFGIINPDILDLRVDLSGIRSQEGNGNETDNNQDLSGQGASHGTNGESGAEEEDEPMTQEECEAAGGGWSESGQRCVFANFGDGGTEGEAPVITEYRATIDGWAGYVDYAQGTIMYSGGPVQCNLYRVHEFATGVRESDGMTACLASQNSSAAGEVVVECTTQSSVQFPIPDACAGQRGQI